MRDIRDDLYRGYHEWKSWKDFFVCDADYAEYFSREFAGIPLIGRSVLEIGFGEGKFLAWARAQGAEIFGAELLVDALDAARRFGVTLLDPEIESVAMRYANRFDLIVAFDVFEHFDLETVIVRTQAVETMLKRGGLFLLRFPNGQSPFGLGPQHGDVTHRSVLSRGKFEQIVLGSSLVPIAYRGQARFFGPRPLKHMQRRIRAALQDFVFLLYRILFGVDFPLAPVVVLLMSKNPEETGLPPK